MALLCDVCKSEVAEGTRFCPKCGLEIVPERERVSRPPPLEKDVFDWDESPGRPKEYEFSRKQVPGLDAQRTAELLQLADARLASGEVLDASALLKQVRLQLIHHKTLRGAFERMTKVIDARRAAIRQRCIDLADAGAADQLVALLAGQAANELEPEQICAIGLATARTLFQARRAGAAADVLRLAPFRTLRDEKLVLEHRQLELQVHRMRARQHALRSFVYLGSVAAAAAVALSLFAILIWQGGMKLALWILIPTAVIAAVLGSNVRQFRAWWQAWLDRSASRPRSALRQRRK
jgi:hypothetical protein